MIEEILESNCITMPIMDKEVDGLKTTPEVAATYILDRMKPNIIRYLRKFLENKTKSDEKFSISIYQSYIDEGDFGHMITAVMDDPYHKKEVK